MNQIIMGVIAPEWMVVHCLVGLVPLTLALVGASGLLLNGVRAHATGRDLGGAVFRAVVGLLTIPIFVVLLFLWSIAIDLSFTSSVLAWSAILTSGHGCVWLARKWQRERLKPTDSLPLAA